MTGKDTDVVSNGVPAQEVGASSIYAELRDGVSMTCVVNATAADRRGLLRSHSIIEHGKIRAA